jgi:hypothetical protein
MFPRPSGNADSGRISLSLPIMEEGYSLILLFVVFVVDKTVKIQTTHRSS